MLAKESQGLHDPWIAPPLNTHMFKLYLKRTLGVILIILGIIMGFLPILQGWILILAGVALLEWDPAKRFLARIKQKWNARKQRP